MVVRGIGLVVSLILVGCATVPGGREFSHAQAPSGTRSEPAKAAVCLPSGVPAFHEWKLVQARPLVMAAADGRPVLGLYAVYAVGAKAITSAWVEGRLVMVDASPDAQVPEWFDTAVIERDQNPLTLKAPPWGACRWRQGGGVPA